MEKRKLWFVALLLVGVVAYAGEGEVSANSQSQPLIITLNGLDEEFQNKPFLQNGSVYLPLRETGTMLDSHTTWIAEGKRIVITNPTTRIEMKLGSKQAIVNGKTYKMRSIPDNRQGVVYVPARFVSEAFGAKVSWIAEERRALIDVEKPYLYAAHGESAYWFDRTGGEVFVSEGASAIELAADTEAEVKDMGELTVDQLSDDVAVLKVSDIYGEPHVHHMLYKFLLIDGQLALESEAYYYGHSIRSIDRSANDHALLMDGAVLYEVDEEGSVLADYDLQAITGYEDDSFQVEWADEQYYVVRPAETGWLTLIDLESKQATRLMDVLLDDKKIEILESLDKYSPEFHQWDGLQVIGREGDALLLSHNFFIGNEQSEYTYKLNEGNE
ncbi:copper amine oxidase N-terminal domain-containing protein [Paenibacillus sp. J5C_2022]|uniref:copper amine oxidase N-terminal domain-containing protein n=1 Tax=Paenibacillus sp. J5C2022 TaxID=2977129 RepID=UPI0021D00187|nr:copper amine oxidase N-terminal domain-containing protein [Paenibacillus sp. J5C2022]MCU6709177.1 copper amine oxidase N-terminal domain-containing protein [Paenibacillus sp. J5C2022]